MSGITLKFYLALAYENDPSMHPSVRVDLVSPTEENEMDMLSIVMRINRFVTNFSLVCI